MMRSCLECHLELRSSVLTRKTVINDGDVSKIKCDEVYDLMRE